MRIINGLARFWWRFFNYGPLGLISLFLAVITILVGDGIPQGKSVAFYRMHYGNWGSILQFFELDNLYGSWWLVLLAFCSSAWLLSSAVDSFWKYYNKSSTRSLNQLSIPMIKIGLVIVLFGGYLEQNHGVRGYLRLNDSYLSSFQQQLRYGLSKEIDLGFSIKAKKFELVAANESNAPLNYNCHVEILAPQNHYEHHLELGQPWVLNSFNLSLSSYYQDPSNQRFYPVIEVASHPGKWFLIVAAILLLLGVLLMAVPKPNPTKLAEESQQ